jgi:hypothetical protein
MEIKAEYLRQRYSILETEELIDLKRKGGLTDVALGVINEILNTRGVSDEIPAELTTQSEETTPRSIEAVILKTKWLSIWNYICLPLNGIINIYIVLTSPEILFGFIATILAIVQLSTAWGLHYRKMWAWRLNWIALLINYFCGVTLPRLIKHSYGYEEPGTQLVLRIIFGALIWILPNIIYWEKRKNLFTKKAI